MSQMNKISMGDAFGEQVTMLVDGVNLDKSDALGGVNYCIT